MAELLAEIQDGRFADELDKEICSGSPQIQRGRKAAESHLIEQVGAALRAKMPWLKKME